MLSVVYEKTDNVNLNLKSNYARYILMKSPSTKFNRNSFSSSLGPTDTTSTLCVQLMYFLQKNA